MLCVAYFFYDVLAMQRNTCSVQVNRCYRERDAQKDTSSNQGMFFLHRIFNIFTALNWHQGLISPFKHMAKQEISIPKTFFRKEGVNII